jgi:hypothetical protein
MLLEILHAWAIARLDNFDSSFNRRISQILRNVNLSLVMRASWLFKHATFWD